MPVLNRVSLLCCLLILFALNAVGNNVTKKDIEVPEFHSISLNSGYNVYLKQTNKQSVTIQALDEVYALTEIKVIEGVLHIDIKSDPKTKESLLSKIDNIKVNPTMNIYVSMKKIKSLVVNGSGSISSENSLSTQYVNLEINGDGNMALDLKGATIKTSISGSGDMELKGYANVNTIVMGGSGSLNAFGLDLIDCHVKLTGAGTCQVYATEILESSVFGKGSVQVKGNTKQLKKNVYGDGDVARTH